jgi:hypothetical protein
MSRTVTIKYRDGKKVATVKADSCHGEIPAYSNTYYCVFSLNGQQVARVPRSRLLPKYAKAYEKLFGRPWLDKIRNAERIVLHEYRDWYVRLGGLPDDTVTVWGVNCSSAYWVIVAGSGTKARAVLHVPNNPEVVRRGDARTAIKNLFPGKKVSLLQPTTVAVEL